MSVVAAAFALVAGLAFAEPAAGGASFAGVPAWVVWGGALVLGGATVWQLRTVPRELVLLMITACIDMIGVLMILPLLPFYAERMGAGGFMVGLLVSSFSIAQLVSAPFWGRLSDSWGRRPVLLVALFASAVAYLVFGFAGSLPVLFVSRIVQGAGGGTVSVIQAYVADATEPGERTKALGWLSAATNFGVAIGPVLGGYAAGWGTTLEGAGLLARGSAERFPGIGAGLAAALLCLVNIVFAAKYLPEVRVKSDTPRPRGTSMKAVTRVVSHPGDAPSRLIWIYSIAIGAFQGLTSILALYMSRTFGATEQTLGLLFAEIGVLSVITRVFVLGRMVDWLGEARLSRLGTVLLALGIGLLPLVPSLEWGALVIALWPLGTAFTFPAVTGLLSKVISQHDRGLYMGVQQTFGGLSRVIFPVVLGFAFDRDASHHAPFWISATLVIATLGFSFALPASVTARTPRPRPSE